MLVVFGFQVFVYAVFLFGTCVISSRVSRLDWFVGIDDYVDIAD